MRSPLQCSHLRNYFKIEYHARMSFCARDGGFEWRSRLRFWVKMHPWILLKIICVPVRDIRSSQGPEDVRIWQTKLFLNAATTKRGIKERCFNSQMKGLSLNMYLFVSLPEFKNTLWYLWIVGPHICVILKRKRMFTLVYFSMNTLK